MAGGIRRRDGLGVVRADEGEDAFEAVDIVGLSTPTHYGSGEPSYASSMVGFALVGLGFSVIIPELFRVAGRSKGTNAAEGIAVVAGMDYVDCIASPAILGFLADWQSLWTSFLALMLAALAAGVLGGVLRARVV